MGCCLKKQVAFENKPIIVTLCGSTKFKHYFHQKNAELTRQGIIVLSVGVFVHADKIQLTIDDKDDLDILHKQKIDMSDYIYVINIGDHIGDSTASEIAYAINKGIPVYYWEEL